MKIHYAPLPAEVIAAARNMKPGRVAVDLTDYCEAIQFALQNDNAVGVTIDEGDSIKAVKGRFTRAARDSFPSKMLRYIRSDDPNTLNILVDERDPNAPKRGRKPKDETEPTASANGSKARKGELVAV